jgi:hypothetical protein
MVKPVIKHIAVRDEQPIDRRERVNLRCEVRFHVLDFDFGLTFDDFFADGVLVDALHGLGGGSVRSCGR